jgi:hypothetical protein
LQKKAEQLQRLDASEMVLVKSVIDKEVENFERALTREFQPYWKPRQPVELDSISHFSRPIGLADWKNYD